MPALSVGLTYLLDRVFSGPQDKISASSRLPQRCETCSYGCVVPYEQP